jgi:hypothetical protein
MTLLNTHVAYATHEHDATRLSCNELWQMASEERMNLSEQKEWG